MLQILALFSEILPIVFYLCFLRRNKGTGLWVIFLYCVLSILVEIFTAFGLGIGKFYLNTSFTIFEYALFTLLIYSSLKEKKLRYIPIAGSVIFALMTVYQLINKKSETFDTFSVSVEAILIIIYSILFLYQEIKTPSISYIYDTKHFWVVMAFFLYFSSTLFLFIYAETLTKQEHDSYWAINNFFEILKNILICIAFTMKKDRKPGIILENSYSDLL